MERADYKRILGSSVSYLGGIKRRYYSQTQKKHGLGGPVGMITICLSKNPGASQEFLAETLAIEKTVVARTAQKLEKCGYIDRETDPDNRRRYRLNLTEKGESLAEEFWQNTYKWCEDMTRGFSEEEMAAAAELVSRMAENVTNVQD